MRFGFLDSAEVPVVLSLGVTAALAVLVVAWSGRLFSTGRRLKA